MLEKAADKEREGCFMKLRADVQRNFHMTVFLPEPEEGKVREQLMSAETVKV